MDSTKPKRVLEPLLTFTYGAIAAVLWLTAPLWVALPAAAAAGFGVYVASAKLAWGHSIAFWDGWESGFERAEQMNGPVA